MRKIIAATVALALLLGACAVAPTTEESQTTTQLETTMLLYADEPNHIPPNQELYLSPDESILLEHTRTDCNYFGIHSTLYLVNAQTGARQQLPLGTLEPNPSNYITLRMRLNERFFTYIYEWPGGWSHGQVFDTQRNRVIMEASVAEIEGDRVWAVPPGMALAHQCCYGYMHYIYLHELEGESPQLRPTNIRMADHVNCCT